MLGSEFLNLFQKKGTDFLAPDREELDLLDFVKTKAFIIQHQPSKIILCAAYTDVGKAEREEKKLCQTMNRDVIGNLLKTKVPIIHFSTDYVFGHYNYDIEIEEDFERAPLNYYGQTKLEAEQLLEQSNVPFWNIRISWLFGEHGKNFVSTILEASKEKEELTIIADQVGRPTYAKDLARFIVNHFIDNQQPTGHYHLQNTGQSISWAGFATHFLKLSGWDGEVQETTSKEWDSKVERPQNSTLKNTKLTDNLPDWESALERFLKSRP